MHRRISLESIEITVQRFRRFLSHSRVILMGMCRVSQFCQTICFITIPYHTPFAIMRFRGAFYESRYFFSYDYSEWAPRKIVLFLFFFIRLILF